MDLSYILMAPNQAELLARITAWNRLCEEEERKARKGVKHDS